MENVNMVYVVKLLLLACCLYGQETQADFHGVPIVVLSQSNLHHVRRAAELKRHLYDQSKDVDVYFLHERWTQPGSWTVLAIISDLVKHFPRRDAVFFCEEETRINLNLLYTELNNYDLKKELFLGYGLRDKEPTIIHHFAFHEDPSSFVYPDFAAGFLLSMPLIKNLATRLTEKPLSSDFAIDAKHELATFIWNKGDGIKLQEVDFLCIRQKTGCATWIPLEPPKCGDPVPGKNVLFAVKTCHKFHEDRVPVVKETWGKEAELIEYYSDKYDPSIPTINLGIENTERGHCGKTLAILKKFRQREDFEAMDWLVIADDDTLFNVVRLYHLLACYDAEEPVALGERYGYGVHDKYSGYNYITGGGGMVFSRQLVKMLLDTGICQCPGLDSPDDMILGTCIQRLHVPIVHSSLFHQARPMDYSADYLSHQEPVSFHKHWMVDPYMVYRRWLEAGSHDEL